MTEKKDIVKDVLHKLDTCFYCGTEGTHHYEVKTLFIQILKNRRNKGIKKVCLECIELKGLKNLLNYTEIVQLKNGFIEEI